MADDIDVDAPAPARFGYLTSLATVLLTVITFTVALMTPPLSGPFCAAASCYEYPYTDILSRFPRDYYYMFPTIVWCLLFVAMMAAIHQFASRARKYFSLVALSFAVMGATILVANYFLQLSVIQPSLAAGETEGIALISQYNPHGVFITLDEIGYLLIALSMGSAAPVFSGNTWPERIVRWAFALAPIVALVGLLIVAFAYGISREYIFEVMVITIVWLALIVGGSALTMVFRSAHA